MFDCHVHSNFSCDSDMRPDSACEAAIELGLTGIAFTDHLDYDFPDFEDEFLIDFDKYSRFMDDLKEKYKDRLKVLKGIEVGIQPHVIEDSAAVVVKYDFDFVIGSVHILDGVDPYRHPYYENKKKHDAYERYLKKILFMVKNYEDFDIVGHFNYIIRCAKYSDNSMKYSDFNDLFDSIFKILISKGKGFEVNTGSFKDKNDGRVLPEYDIHILKRYKELGGEILTIGSDAHYADYLGYKFDFFKYMIKKAGFKYITYFENRKPVFTPIT